MIDECKGRRHRLRRSRLWDAACQCFQPNLPHHHLWSSNMDRRADLKASGSGQHHDPSVEPIHAESRRHIKRGVACVVAAFAAPAVIGTGAMAFATIVLTLPPGMESYVPLLMGMAGGAVLGLVLLGAGVGQLLMAWRLRKLAATLLD